MTSGESCRAVSRTRRIPLGYSAMTPFPDAGIEPEVFHSFSIQVVAF